MKKLLVVGMSLVVLAGCSSSNGWTDSQERVWMNYECMNGPNACACMLDYFKDNGYSHADVAGSEGFSIGFKAGTQCGFG